MIKGDWKLLVGNLISEKDSISVQLFNLSNDTGESTDLSGETPEKVTEILLEMRQSHIHSDLFAFPELEYFYNNNSFTKSE